VRGFLLGALVLVGLDVMLSSPAARVLGVLTPFTDALVKWLDPTVPLISEHHAAAPGPAAGKPPGPKPPGEVRQRAGKCPPGWLPDPQHPGYCIQTLP